MFIKVNACWLFPCEHGGTCKPNGVNYTCSCTKSSYGNNCQFFRDSNANNSTILNYVSMKNLKTLVNLPLNKSWYLMYQASFDGFKQSSFDSKLNGVLGTLILIKSENSNIFGGYTEVNWNYNSYYTYDNRAFLFSLINTYGIPVKLAITNPSYAIYSYTSNQIMFGSGSDLAVNFNDASGYSNLGNSYRVPSFLSTDPNEIYSFLGGSFSFRISEIEAYSIQVDGTNCYILFLFKSMFLLIFIS